MIQVFCGRNDRAEPVNAAMAQTAYEHFFRVHRDRVVNDYYESRLDAGNPRDRELTPDEIIRRNPRPSAADLHHYANRLLERAYERMPAGSEEELRITEDVIKETCRLIAGGA